MHGSYIRFGLTIAISTIVMYALMFLNVWSSDHIFWSQTRAWMALIMGATMAVIMLLSMWKMYPRTGLNVAIFMVSALLFGGSLYMVRSQVAVDDVSWMRAMIPHHSIAILTSERAKIQDPRVRHLADGIIETQKREIGEMQNLIAEMRPGR